MGSTSMIPQKRKLPLPEIEKKLYDLIWSKESLGIWTLDMKKLTGLTQVHVRKALKSLQSKNLIKDVVNIHSKGKKIYMAVEFEPSNEISGGTWYSDGSLDVEYIGHLRNQCLFHVERSKIATLDSAWKYIRDSGIFKAECTMQQIKEIMGLLVLDRQIEELASSGVQEFSHIQTGRRCYRVLKSSKGPKEGVLGSIPCGVCPRITDCSPDGVISPQTCVYYNKWLGLDF